MNRLYYVRTNGYDMLVLIDGDKDCFYLTDDCDDVFPTDDNEIEGFVNGVEDWSSWNNDVSYEDMLGILDEHEILFESEI